MSNPSTPETVETQADQSAPVITQVPDGFRPDIAHIIAADGRVFQVLNGNDWDEAATAASVS